VHKDRQQSHGDQRRTVLKRERERVMSNAGVIEVCERALLGAILIDPSTWARVAVLNPEHFTLEANRRIYRCMGALAALGHPIEISSLTAELEKRDQLELIGGGGYLGALIDGAVPESVDYYVKSIQAHARRKWFCQKAEQAFHLALDSNVSMSALPVTTNLACVLLTRQSAGACISCHSR
jgi:replicative DNA helicase